MASTEGDFRGLHQFSVKVTAAFLKDDEERNDYEMVDYAIHRLFYAGIAVIFMMIVALVVKLMWNCDGDGGGGRVNESSRLLPSPEKDEGDVDTLYGGTDDTDLGSGSSSSSWTSSEDGKVCVICYDDPRECFFIPCGHCIACQTCSTRIMKQGSKSCPICRGTIDKMRMLQIS